MRFSKQFRSLVDGFLAPNSAITLKTLPFWKQSLITPIRILYAVILDIFYGQITLRTMSLVYTTMLSFVPLLAISFSILKSFGVQNRMKPFLQEMLAPLGPQGDKIISHVIGFVNNVQVGLLGIIGFLFLFYTVISLIEKLERALNYIWYVPSERPISQKVRDYLVVVTIGPVLIFAGIGTLTALMNSAFLKELSKIGPFNYVVETAGRFLSAAIVIAAFTFLYSFLPNTKVNFLSATVGGFFAAFMWAVAGWCFSSFIVGSTNYTVIYSAFAALVLFMIWLYILWLIVLVGSSVSFYVQNSHYVGIRRDSTPYSIELREKVALIIVYKVVRFWYDSGAKITIDDLVNSENLPMPVVVEIVRALKENGLITSPDVYENQLMPGLPPEETPLRLALKAVRTHEGKGHGHMEMIDPPGAVKSVIDRIDASVCREIGAMTIKEFSELP